MKMDTLKCCITVKGYKTIQTNKNVTTTETNEGGKHTHATTVCLSFTYSLNIL